MKITIVTTTEAIQELETLLRDYERLITDVNLAMALEIWRHCYSQFEPDEFNRIVKRIWTINAEINRMIGQAERQINQPDLSGVHE